MDTALEYWIDNDICYEDDYSYTALTGECKTCDTGIRILSCSNIQDNPADVINELFGGPVATAADASEWTFYKSGVLTDCKTNPTHGVTLVAYNKFEDYVTIRNSWGKDWGENGHIRLGALSGTCKWHLKASVPHFYP